MGKAAPVFMRIGLKSVKESDQGPGFAIKLVVTSNTSQLNYW